MVKSPALPETGFFSQNASRGDELNICHGRPLFPPAAPGFNALNYSVSKVIFNGSTSHAVFRASAGASYNFTAGLCGPAWSAAMRFTPTISGANSENLELAVQELPPYLGVDRDTVVAGLTYGVTLSLRFGVRVDVKHPYVHCHRWGCSAGFHWGRVFNVNSSITIDLIKIVYAIINYQPRPETPPERTIGTSIPGVNQGYNIADAGALDPAHRLEPMYTVRVNMINLIPEVNEANWAASKYGSGIEFGPTFSIIFPTTFRVTHFALNDGSLDNVVYDVASNRTKTKLTGTKSTAASPFHDLPSGEAAVRVQWHMDVTLGLGLYGKVTVLWVISLGFSYTFPMDRLSPSLRIGLGTYNANLYSRIGKVNAWDAVASAPAIEDDPLAGLTPEEVPTFVFAEPETSLA